MQPLRSTLLWASQSPRIERFVRRSGAMRPLVNRFMPGEQLDAALGTVDTLRKEHIPAVLSYLGENVRDQADADRAAAEYRAMIDAIAQGDYDAQISIKLTQLGWDVDVTGARARLHDLVAHAESRRVILNIDMESSRYTDATIGAYLDLRNSHSGVGICLQAYLRRTPEDLERLLPLRPRLRLVKGAYREPASIAFQDRGEIDEHFFAAARRLLEETRNGTIPSFGTHDLPLIDRILAAARECDVAPDAYDVQMLYGIQSDGLRRLAARGEHARVFICYGRAWYPWFMRRLAERPANLLMALRNIV